VRPKKNLLYNIDVLYSKKKNSDAPSPCVLNLYCGPLAINTLLKQGSYVSGARPNESKNSAGPSFGK
jgi:hypothetical protein